MTRRDSASSLSAAAVLEIARLNGVPVDDEAMAARIAAGGSAAVAAVNALHRQIDGARLSDVEPSDYLPTLESLAAKVPGTSSRDVGSRGVKDSEGADLVSTAERLVAGELRSADLVRTALASAERAEARTHCFLSLDKERALRAAELADALLDDARRLGREPLAPLLGIPLAHKDMFDRVGRAATFGSKALEPVVASRNATVLQRLEVAGSISLGTLNMAEFALGATGHNAAWGDCRNAWNPDYISGGSSSGSGAVVACGAAFASLGSDTGGSVRIPASVQGVFGLKPTYGLLPRTGSMKLSPSIDVLGPITRSVRDLALILKIVAGSDGEDAQCSMRPVPNYADALGLGVEGLRIGVPKNHFFDRLDPQIRFACERSLASFEAAGAQLVEVEVPFAAHLAELSRAIVYSEATAVHGETLRSRGTKYSPQVRVRASTGLAIPGTHYLEALQGRIPLLQRFVKDVFSRCEILLTPTLPIRVPRRDETDVGAGTRLWEVLGDLVRCTAPFNYLGLPAISVPAGLDDQGLPIGVQLVGAPFDEPTLLAAAAAHELALPPPKLAN
ncbi:MAG: amidase [Gammaproteobacteria bacterium]|jgi:aspartyl-tRNA(Asn)/glutamyl-tRNA(Gln) amidotransferase subunit A|nr:amidase [Gammaproteobacteria bacterium]